MVRYVYDFTEGGRDMADLLGGKGANLAEMTRLGLPVPPGFIVTTEACRAFLATDAEPEGMSEEISRHLKAVEQAVGRSLGQRDDPLLLSVRSGARFSMPGMMETVLDIGLNDESVQGLAKTSGNERFAWDSYRRLVQMFGSTVMGVGPALFEEAMALLKEAREAPDDVRLDASDLAWLVETYKSLIRDETGQDFPQSPAEQLRLAVLAVFRSWNGERARLYRRREHIPEDLGTAVTVQRMVFGNLGADSGSGVAFTRDPATGRPGLYGDYLSDAQGEDVVAGTRNTVPLTDLERLDPESHRRLCDHMGTLERHYRDLCDIEFTIERGTLWMLQTRVGKRTAEAAFAIAAELVEEGLITPDEALARVSGSGLARLMFPRFDTTATGDVLARGLPASPGAGVGAAVFDSAEAVRRAAAGEKVVLVRHETTPDDLPGMLAAQAVLTSRGGKTSHAAVVARGMGKVCVCGAEELTVNTDARRFTTRDGAVVEEGTVLSVDGSAGAVYLGGVPLVASAFMRYLETGEQADGIVAAAARALRRADSVRRLEVRANADTPEDATRARRFGAQGVGLCRTEHMFLGERRKLVEEMILARTDGERERALRALLPLQRRDFAGILEAMDGLPVTIRLLDPPLHEFLPDRTELAVRVATAEARGELPAAHDTALLEAVDRMHEENPMLGLRGVRLGLVVPGLVAMQVRAIAEAVVERVRAGGAPRAEIMVPLVGAVEELRLAREEVEQVLARVSEETGVPVRCPVGTMIELPRAALTAGRIAEEAEFFSFGTNDLTQTAWGFSRDDVEAAFFSAYLDKGVFTASPFETIDRDGVGRLVRIAVDEGRAARPDLTIGVCGEHGGDPESVHFFHAAGLDYVSCSPFRIPVARLEAGRATLARTDVSDSR
ncbi:MULTISPECIES: pyruvate, phosphate dikinase [Streptomyces]|uniref:Pyruvate, phosphate dikinase n=1 Tax=Streptomyces scabiei (strain 87.22) TaxID=680198 RepID=C9Z3H8_STRSW|nr:MULTISPECIES: pyruvate, phosphate dikinase [Streptomyces]MBP5859823.1 pyruvate, phosphate dikinase [Streptomyces sp. LBUM 1484]MBP5871476.1 pyruvate, phosphate dikinase [Streptomyces sp. LBUM 1485]KFG06310.1 pyruvate phosphate dikinase [Streptomyces scabiei]MBP5879920.1 pyruvate, phosphate dikinase [Streptomyces sp. LBUM 1477]MBP5887747.1 pyruvate, phosphate dikinase [Streptomyces sp. LBUM 1487]